MTLSFWSDVVSNDASYDQTTDEWERELQLAALNEALAWASSAAETQPTRWLQSDIVDAANANRTTPEEICAGYNNQTSLECTCRRFEARDIEVNCTYVEPLCFSDNTCIQPRFSQVLNENVQSYVMTTCTNITNNNNSTGASPGESCVRIFPKVNGTYNEIESCSATFTPLGPTNETQPITMDNVCHSCTLCQLPNTTVRGIALDCCNVQVDLKQTCGQVSNESGTSITFFDIIPPEEQGQCNGSTPMPIGTATTMPAAATTKPTKAPVTADASASVRPNLAKALVVVVVVGLGAWLD